MPANSSLEILFTMTTVNIRRVVENIRSNTNSYTPIIETVVNAIQAIQETERQDGEIMIYVQRSMQIEIDNAPSDVTGFIVEDNGVGFTKRHRDSFDKLYSEQKLKEGGKGFGRFTCLKYFKEVNIISTYFEDAKWKQRRFSMGRDEDIIVHEKEDVSEKQESGSSIHLRDFTGKSKFDKSLRNVARIITERVLPYFITDGYRCPKIYVAEPDGSNRIQLNDFIHNELSREIQEIKCHNNVFTINSPNACDNSEEFNVRVFKFFSPKNQKSRLSLVAHQREVPGSPIQKYVPEFEDEFYEKCLNGETYEGRNYIVKAYVFGDYLDRNVSLERGGFEFDMDDSLLFDIGQTKVERDAALIARVALGDEITSRETRKRERIQNYVDQEAPWHKVLLKKLDMKSMPLKPTNEEIEMRLQRQKFQNEVEIKREIITLLSSDTLDEDKDIVSEVVSKISVASQNDLIHYIATRRKIIEIFSRSLDINAAGSYNSEGHVHDVIFPRKGSTETTPFMDHNLWIIDERLNFTSYVSSDLALDDRRKDIPDLLVYNKRVLFRGDNEPSNPITIFEFKKPQRDDFVNPSSKEDPVAQIVRYVNSIREGKYKTPEGRPINVAKNTPFYGYVICDLTYKVEQWLEFEKNFDPMPDRQGWFDWFKNINLYVEVLSWEKVLRDAKMRNRIFFEKLGI